MYACSTILMLKLLDYILTYLLSGSIASVTDNVLDYIIGTAYLRSGAFWRQRRDLGVAGLVLCGR